MARARGRHSRARPSRRPSWLPALSLALLLLAGAAGGAVLGWDRWPTSGHRVPTAAVTAAKQAVQDILSYDYRTVEADIARARRQTTGSFRTQYEATATALLPQSKQVKAIVQATVGSAGVMSSTSDRVVVLLFVDQATVKQEPGAKVPVTRIDQTRVRVTMSRVSGRWLVSELSAL